MSGSGGSLTKRSEDEPDGDPQIGAYLAGRGDAARDAADWDRAALFYAEALRVMPCRADIHARHGQALRESGALTPAEIADRKALEIARQDFDLSLQLGNFYQSVNQPDLARIAFEQALAIRPDWKAAERELAGLAAAHSSMAHPHPGGRNAKLLLAEAAEAFSEQEKQAELVSALEPQGPLALLHDYSETLNLRQMGGHERGPWGVKRTVHGVTAIRGFCISALPIVEAQMLLNGQLFHRAPVRGPYSLKHQRFPTDLAKYVFNIWYDFGSLLPGRHAFELRLIDAEGDARSFHDDLVIALPRKEADFPSSDAVVEVSGGDAPSLELRIRDRASMARPARRDVLPRHAKSILVLRTDQLGDLVASIPAMRRLRALFSSARIVGVFTAANADLAATTGLFDEVITIDFPDDSFERRRVMPRDAQRSLRERFAPYQFDLAIDLAQAGVSRELLLLSGAPFLYGVQGGDFHWLSADFALNTRDPVNRLDIVPHSRKTLALVETLGAIVGDSFQVMRRNDLGRERLERYGISPADHYVVLHMGARVPFSRWPGFPELAALLMERTNLKVVMMTEDADVRQSLPSGLLASPRFQLLDQRLDFDDFDAFLSFATVLVGNDSGPKHLASLRGTNTVTLHTARINWNTWGHEGEGVIMSRRVPCAGCDIFYDAEDCGKDFACIRDIRPEEVFEAVSAYV